MKKRSRVVDILNELCGEDDPIPSDLSIKEAMIISEERIQHPEPIRRDNECAKVCYDSASQVRRAITNRLRKGANCDKLRHYFCDLCQAFHMTSSFHR